MTMEKVKCCWCDGEFSRSDVSESRFLGGMVCNRCDADESGRTLGEIHDRLKVRSKGWVEDGAGWVK